MYSRSLLRFPALTFFQLYQSLLIFFNQLGNKAHSTGDSTGHHFIEEIVRQFEVSNLPSQNLPFIITSGGCLRFCLTDYALSRE